VKLAVVLISVAAGILVSQAVLSGHAKRYRAGGAKRKSTGRGDQEILRRSS
jgi:hypothetical protein